MQAITKAGYKPGGDVMLALDCAATEFYKDGILCLRGRGQEALEAGAGEVSRAILSRKYPIVSIEDGMAEDDWEGWKTADDD